MLKTSENGLLCVVKKNCYRMQSGNGFDVYFANVGQDWLVRLLSVAKG